MRWLLYGLAIALETTGLTLGLAAVYATLALAPDAVSDIRLARMERVEDIRTLSWLHGQAEADLAQMSPPRLVQNYDALAPYYAVSQVTFLLGQRLGLETAAEKDFARAQELATQAMATRNRGQGDDAATLQQEEFLWQAAIAQLDQIPARSLLADEAAAKRQEYRAAVQPVSAQVDAVESQFLAEIAAETGRPQAIRIALCHLSGECRHFQGDVPPASPASLIKLPIAVALMDKVVREDIDLDTEIYIEPYNWTENARGAKIFVDRTYSLREVMVRMIKESNNIATNQLVDYLGWAELNQILSDRGFPNTTVNTKLAGDSTLPSVNRNSGGGPNTMTANEMTEMMRQVYTFAHPGDEELLDALVGQYDWDFGYRAIKQMKRSDRVAWIGEKTGQNSKVIGSSVAVKIDDQRYILTVTIDHSANQAMLRQVIGDVIQHILDEGHLVSRQRVS
jgi:beta-lactamase class A